MKVLLFGGTSEGRAMAQALGRTAIPFAVCVATGYGGELLPPETDVRVGRLDGGEMAALMDKESFTHVVDATHPYAAAATEHIQAAAAQAHLPHYRLVRDGDVEGDWLRAGDMAQAARLAERLPGNVLLTTGSKELNAFSAPGLRERCYPRVLASLTSLSRCLELGFPASQVICMQGPFSRELNEAMLLQFGIKILVTKATGGAGGFWEKVEAAQAAGCTLIVVERPTHETGHSLEELIRLLKEEART